MQCMRKSRKTQQYPSDTSNEEWDFIAPYLLLLREDAAQREYPLRDMFDAVRWIVRTGSPWRYLPHDFPPWNTVYQQARRWIKAQVFDDMVHDLRIALRLESGRNAQPSAAIFDSRTIQSTPESGDRAGYDGGKKKKGSKVHMAVDTMGNLLSLHISPANEQDRAHTGKLAETVQIETVHSVELAWVDQGYTGDKASEDAKSHGVELEVVKRPEGSRGFILLPRRWVVERSFGWMSRCRRLGRDLERCSETLRAFHYLAFAMVMFGRWISMS